MSEKNICQFSFNIVDWKIVCNKQLSVQDWQLGYEHWQQNFRNFEEFTPLLSFLPPMKRRRLSDSARLFFEAAWELADKYPNSPVVYASENSEINRSFTLWQSLLTEGDVSPTSFSLSVHNALIGQWSELKQVKAETTAITAYGNNLETALLEAYLLLNDGAERVLVLVAESPLLEKYNVQPTPVGLFSYAAAFIVEAGNQFCLTLTNENAAEQTVDSTLEWVKNYYLQQTQWRTSHSNGGAWLWQKN